MSTDQATSIIVLLILIFAELFAIILMIMCAIDEIKEKRQIQAPLPHKNPTVELNNALKLEELRVRINKLEKKENNNDERACYYRRKQKNR